MCFEIAPPHEKLTNHCFSTLLKRSQLQRHGETMKQLKTRCFLRSTYCRSRKRSRLRLRWWQSQTAKTSTSQVLRQLHWTPRPSFRLQWLQASRYICKYSKTNLRVCWSRVQAWWGHPILHHSRSQDRFNDSCGSYRYRSRCTYFIWRSRTDDFQGQTWSLH